MSETLTQFNRRALLMHALVLWQAASKAAAQHAHPPPRAANAAYRFTFLNSAEQATLRILMACVIPADERSGGAVGARTDEHIDFVLTHADQQLQQSWRSGLKNYGAAVAGHKEPQVDDFLSRQAANEFAPATDDEVFFVLLKTAIVEGFYTSEEGINNELRYQGMGFLLDWQGCTHQQHEAPIGWKPLLKQRPKSLL